LVKTHIVDNRNRHLTRWNFLPLSPPSWPTQRSIGFSLGFYGRAIDPGRLPISAINRAPPLRWMTTGHWQKNASSRRMTEDVREGPVNQRESSSRKKTSTRTFCTQSTGTHAQYIHRAHDCGDVAALKSYTAWNIIHGN